MDGGYRAFVFHSYADIGVMNGSNLVIFTFGRGYRAIIHKYPDIGVLKGSHLVMNDGFHMTRILHKG